MNESQLSDVIHNGELLYPYEYLGVDVLIGLVAGDCHFVGDFVELGQDYLGLKAHPHCDRWQGVF